MNNLGNLQKFFVQKLGKFSNKNVKFTSILILTTLYIVNTADPNGGIAQRPVFIEELIVFSTNVAIDKLKVVRDEVGSRAKLGMISNKMPISTICVHTHFKSKT